MGSIQIVPPGEGSAFLADLPIDDLPVSAEMRRRLRLLGLRRLGDLAALPRGAVAAEFGAEGARSWELAHGIDRSLLVPYRPPLSLAERLVFPAPVETTEVLLVAVKRLLERALRRPEMHGRAARRVGLRVHLEDDRVWERQVTFREPVGSAERMLVVLRSKIEGAVSGGRAGSAGPTATGGPGAWLSPPAPGPAWPRSGASPACFVEVELVLLDLCGESAFQGGLFPSKRSRSPLDGDRVREAARQLKARYGRPVLARIMEVEPWSRIPERRFALIDYDP